MLFLIGEIVILLLAGFVLGAMVGVLLTRAFVRKNGLPAPEDADAHDDTELDESARIDEADEPQEPAELDEPADTAEADDVAQEVERVAVEQQAAQLSEARAHLDRQGRELLAARRQIADLKGRFRDVTGLEAELVAAQEQAARVPELHNRITWLEQQLGPRDVGGEANATDGPPDGAPTAHDDDHRGAPVGDVSADPPSSAQTADAPDDLMAIEGIDRHVAAFLRTRGIQRVEQLAELSAHDIAAIDFALGVPRSRSVAGPWAMAAAELVAARRAKLS